MLFVSFFMPILQTVLKTDLQTIKKVYNPLKILELYESISNKRNQEHLTFG